MNLKKIQIMADAKGYTEKWIDLLSKAFGIVLTFLGAQIAFWALSFINEALSDRALIIAIIGLSVNFLAVFAIVVFLVKKINIFGGLKK
jgi:hypothetical protein